MNSFFQPNAYPSHFNANLAYDPRTNYIYHYAPLSSSQYQNRTQPQYYYDEQPSGIDFAPPMDITSQKFKNQDIQESTNLSYAPNIQLQEINISLNPDPQPNQNNPQRDESPIPIQWGKKEQEQSPTEELFKRANSKTLKGRKNHYLKTIENDMIERTACIGFLEKGEKEFDDYFEKHVSQFFTPEMHQIILYHDEETFFGLQVVYRDPWGTMIEKETFKGDLHMAKNLIARNWRQTSLNLDYDEYLTEMYVDGNEKITYMKFVTNNNRVLELGQSQDKFRLQNMVQPTTRILAVGGTYDQVLRSLYFYYS